MMACTLRSWAAVATDVPPNLATLLGEDAGFTVMAVSHGDQHRLQLITTTVQLRAIAALCKGSTR